MYGKLTSSNSNEYYLSEQECVELINLEKLIKEIYYDDIYNEISSLIKTFIKNGKITRNEMNNLYRLLQIKSIRSYGYKFINKDIEDEDKVIKNENEVIDINYLHRKNQDEINLRWAILQINHYKIWVKGLLKVFNLSESNIPKRIKNDLSR